MSSPGLNMRNDGLEALAAAARGALFTVTRHREPAVRAHRVGAVRLLPARRRVRSDRPRRQGARDSDRRPRRGAIVRTRRQLLNVPADLNRPRTPRDAVAAALTAPLLMSALPLRVATFALRGPEQAKVQLLIRPTSAPTIPAPRPAVGRLRHQRPGRPRVESNRTVRCDSAPLMAGCRARCSTRLGASLAPGDYTMKFAVAEGDRVGTRRARRACDAWPISARSTLSELMVGGPVGRRRAPAADGRLHGQLRFTARIPRGLRPSPRSG